MADIQPEKKKKEQPKECKRLHFSPPNSIQLSIS